MRLSKMLAVIGAVYMLAISACKEPEGIGLEVLPDGEEMPIAWIDSFTVVAQTVLYDSVQTSGLNSGTYLVGDFGDPIFGRTRSEVYTEILLQEASTDFGSGPVIDSIILNLAYVGSYGATDKVNGNMRFGVFEVEEDLHPTGTGDSTYFSNTEIDLAPTPIAEFDFRPDLFSGILTYATNNDTLPELVSPSLRVRLADEFGQRILNSQNLASQDIFAEEFEGICVKPTAASMPDGNGSILYFNLVSGNSRVELYYHNADGDTLYVPFEIDNSHGAHTRFDHDHPTAITDVLGDTSAGADRLYIQSMAGLRMKVELPHIRKLNELGAVAVNKAELVVPIDESVITDFGYPTALQVTGIDSSDGAVFLIDLFEGSDYHGGTYDAANGEYVFNIARHIQSLLNAPEEPDYGLYIVNSGNAVNANRGVFNGPEHAIKPMKLRMTYTIIE